MAKKFIIAILIAALCAIGCCALAEDVASEAEIVEEVAVEKVEEKAEEKVEQKVEEKAEEKVEEPKEETVAEPVEEAIEETTEEPVEETVEETAEEAVEETAEEAAEETTEEVTEEAAEETVEETTEETTEEAFTGRFEVRVVGNVRMGEQVTLEARGYDVNRECSIQWQCRTAGGEWKDISGENGSTYNFELTDANVEMEYRVAVTVL